MIDEVKVQISIQDVFSTYGIKLTRNKALCPFHSEKTPSLVVYPHTNSFYCFGCGIGGDVVTFVSQLYNLEPLEAAKKLNEDFGLGLSGRQLTEEQRHEIGARIRQQEQDNGLLASYEVWEAEYYDYLCKSIKALEDLRDAANPGKSNGEFTDDFAFAVNQLVLLEYHWEILYYGDSEDKVALYMDIKRREAVTACTA